MVARQDGQRTFVAVFDAGDEVMSTLSSLAEDEGFSAASLTGVGAVQEATLGWYDLEVRQYREIARP
jgi:predicted DNA-binding protein with PD1-like motif